MVRTTRQEYEGALGTLATRVESGDVAEADAEAIRRLCAAFDQEDARERLPSDLYDDRKTRHVQPGTLEAWVDRLIQPAKQVTLVEADADELNTYTTTLVKDDDGPSKSRVRGIEHALAKFYRYHDDLGVDHDDLVIHEYDSNGGNGWDARDLLDAAEREALRTVCDHPRDRAILHLALYCGLRNTALRTLRVRDIDTENHEWYFNRDADGLKSVHQPSEPRPLFQAERAVRSWKRNHPDPQPENYFITSRSSASRKDPTAPVTKETIRRVLSDLKDRTAERDDVVTVGKPCHPQMFRHNFVSMCRRHPDVSDADIKFWLGHSPASSVMETTYSHLSSDDHNEIGHAAFGTADAGDPDDDTDPWDATCDQCGRVLSPGDDVCAGCGTDRGQTPWDDVPASPDETDRFRDMVREEIRNELALNDGVPPILALNDGVLPPRATDDDDLSAEERAEQVWEKLGLED